MTATEARAEPGGTSLPFPRPARAIQRDRGDASELANLLRVEERESRGGRAELAERARPTRFDGQTRPVNLRLTFSRRSSTGQRMLIAPIGLHDKDLIVITAVVVTPDECDPLAVW